MMLNNNAIINTSERIIGYNCLVNRFVTVCGTGGSCVIFKSKYWLTLRTTINVPSLTNCDTAVFSSIIEFL